MIWTNRGLESRIDRCYVSVGLTDALQSAWVFPTALSDHKIMITRLCAADIAPHAMGCWRLNARLLDDDTIIKDVARTIKNTTSPSMDAQE